MNDFLYSGESPELSTVESKCSNLHPKLIFISKEDNFLFRQFIVFIPIHLPLTLLCLLFKLDIILQITATWYELCTQFQVELFPLVFVQLTYSTTTTTTIPFVHVRLTEHWIGVKYLTVHMTFVVYEYEYLYIISSTSKNYSAT